MLLFGLSALEQELLPARAPALEDSLILRVAQGDTQAFSELYLRAHKAVYGFALSIVKNQHDAEDVMQDAFCRALISLPTSHVNARAWLYMVGRNLLINEMKKRKRELCSDDMESRDVQSRKSGEGIADGDPEEQAIRKEENSMLQEALLSLGERKREILLLNYFERFTLKEAAVIMGISYENARILSMRAKRELRRIMEVNGYEIS